MIKKKHTSDKMIDKDSFNNMNSNNFSCRIKRITVYICMSHSNTKYFLKSTKNFNID